MIVLFDRMLPSFLRLGRWNVYEGIPELVSVDFQVELCEHLGRTH